MDEDSSTPSAAAGDASPGTPASPASRGVRVAVFGAGIAGLTAAHELAERGFRVTVYERRLDERSPDLFADGSRPPVKLGGMAASQWAVPSDGAHNDRERQVFRAFPGTPPSVDDEPDYLPGEHGFRFFPAYYLHTWDTMQRIPQYEPQLDAGGNVRYLPTRSTVYDNVERIITQGMTTGPGRPGVVFSRVPPQTFAEATSAFGQLASLGFEPGDVAAFGARMARYQATGVERRRREMQRMSAYDFFVDPDPETFEPRVAYGEAFQHQLRDMPKVLAAFDSVYGDARTNLDTYLQLQLDVHRANDKSDGVLNGPTTEAWFDHWYHHLVALGVDFRHGQLAPLELDADGRLVACSVVPHDHEHEPEPVDADYIVVATDAVTAERVCAPVRDRIGGTVRQLAGYTTSRPTDDGPSRLPGTPTAPHRDEVDARDPYSVSELGTKPWDRFQTLSGLQLYFDTAFQLVRGHVYFTDSEWGLSSINQSGLWLDQPSISHNERPTATKYLSHYSMVLSVDIGDWRRPSSHTGKSALESTDDEIAAEVWRQMTVALSTDEHAAPVFPQPRWYTLDRNLVVDDDGYITSNLAPYLVPIVNDWERRPGGPPWNPHGGSVSFAPTADARRAAAAEHVWEAAHGGYQVHGDRLVFAGTWTKTFTRMTSMEAANESARHAVNAIIDHMIHTANGDERADVGLRWEIPFGFLDQRGSGPVRQPTPVGDYCFVYDLENLESAEFRSTRELDDRLALAGKPHPWDSLGIDASIRHASQRAAPSMPSLPKLPKLDEVIEALSSWSSHLEDVVRRAAGPTAPPDTATGPSAPGEVGEDDGLEGRIVVPPIDAKAPTDEPEPPTARLYRPGG